MMTKKFKTKYIKEIREAFYYCEVFIFPDWVNFVAVSEDGGVWGFEEKPIVYPLYHKWVKAKAGAKATYLFSLIIDDETDWKDTLIEMMEVIDPSYNILKKNENDAAKSVLRFSLWKAGETTLVGRIVEAKNIPESKYLIASDKDEFIDEGGLFFINNYNGESKDMVKTFTYSFYRDFYVKDLITHIYTSFHKFYFKATEADIGKEVYITKPFHGLCNLKAFTTDGKYVVEDDNRLLIVDEACIIQENEVSHQIIKYPGGRVLHEFRLM